MKKFSWLILVSTILLGLFLRLYNINLNYYLSGELGKELIYLRQISISHTLPLVGMQTSHEWLRYGPFYYYLMLPLFNLFNGNPFILFWTALVVAGVGLILNYWVIRKIANTQIAIISTILQAISPLMIWQTRLSKLHVFFWILIPVFIYSLFMLWKGKKKWLLWSGIILGLMFSFHFSQLPLFGIVIMLFLIKRKIYVFVDYVKFIFGLVIANLTLLIYDAQNGFVMTKDLTLWIPYKVLGFVGLYSKPTPDEKIGSTLASFNEFLGRGLFWSDKLWIVGTIIFFVIFIHFVYTKRKDMTQNFLTFLLTSSIFFVFVANIIHKAVPVHYFLPIFTFPSILFAIYLQKNIKLAVLILLGLFIVNFNSYFIFIKPDDFVAYSKQNEVVDNLIKKSKGQEFSIQRIGPYDYFPENYSQNYKYLILWKGGKLTENSKLIYTIDENQ